MDRISDVGVIDKAMAVITAVEREPMALAALVDETGLARPTVHRLAVALEAHGLLRRDDEGRFALGPRAVALGRAAADAFPLRDVALPALRDLRDKTRSEERRVGKEGRSRCAPYR